MILSEKAEYGWHPAPLAREGGEALLLPSACGLFSAEHSIPLEAPCGDGMLALVTQGEGTARQGAHGDEYGAGSVVVCAGGAQVVLLPETRTTYLGLALSGADALLLRLRQGGLVHTPPLSCGVEHVFSRICAQIESASQDPYRISAEAYGLLMELCALCGSRQVRHSPLVRQAVAMIREEYAFLEGVEALADALGVSKSHLIRRFKEQTGISPGKYLEKVRLENAQQLLQSGEYSLELVANMVGYAGANYFCKVFRRVCGESPGSWRARHPQVGESRLTGAGVEQMHL